MRDDRCLVGGGQEPFNAGFDEDRPGRQPQVNYRKPASGGPPVVHPVRRVDNVEQTVNGYFGPDDPPLGRDTIRCKKGDPPSWARR